MPFGLQERDEVCQYDHIIALNSLHSSSKYLLCTCCRHGLCYDLGGKGEPGSPCSASCEHQGMERGKSTSPTPDGTLRVGTYSVNDLQSTGGEQLSGWNFLCLLAKGHWPQSCPMVNSLPGTAVPLIWRRVGAVMPTQKGRPTPQW